MAKELSPLGSLLILNLLKKRVTLFLVLNKGKTNYTVYASILKLIRKCDEESPCPDSETEYIRVLYIIVRVNFFVVTSFTVWRME